jgi:glycosyltransferase involved in cell wall biosynthesis
MRLKVLAIGDVGNIIRTIQKHTKKSKIHLINYPRDGAAKFTNPDNIESFKTWKVKEHVKKINEIKNDYDVCISMATEITPYLADLNFISYYVGGDIEAPRFKKNSKDSAAEGNDILHSRNIFERKFYWNAFKNAVTHVAGVWQFSELQKYTKNGIRNIMLPIDTDEFNSNIEPIERKKTKFTFFSPMRMEKFKGTHLLWEALKFCKSDFEILCVEWFGERTNEEREFKKKLLDTKPKQITFVPIIDRSEIPRYYTFADAVIANLFFGSFELVGLESVMCGTPVIQYTDKKKDIILDDFTLQSPFQPFSNDPKAIAEIIDKIVESKEFREELFLEEQKFVNQVADPIKCAEWWDDLFESVFEKHGTIHKKSSPIRIKFRMISFLFGNRLYISKIRNRILGRKNIYEGQTLYES